MSFWFSETCLINFIDFILCFLENSVSSLFFFILEYFIGMIYQYFYNSFKDVMLAFEVASNLGLPCKQILGVPSLLND